MKGAMACALAGSLLAAACSTTSSSKGPSTLPPASCATSADCSGGTVCGFADIGDAGCGAKGVCVQPLDPQPTMLCGCGGSSIQLVVDDVDAGVYFWSGVVIGEMGFPPCGDAAIAPSSNDVDASTNPVVDATTDGAGEAAVDAQADAVSDVVAQ